MADIRKIRFNSDPEHERIQLWRVVGFDPVHRQVIVEDPKTRKRKGICVMTGYLVLKERVNKVIESIDGKVLSTYEYVDPGYPES